MRKLRPALGAAALARGLRRTTPVALADPDGEDVVCGVVTTVGPFLARPCEGKYHICLN